MLFFERFSVFTKCVLSLLYLINFLQVSPSPANALSIGLDLGQVFIELLYFDPSNISFSVPAGRRDKCVRY